MAHEEIWDLGLYMRKQWNWLRFSFVDVPYNCWSFMCHLSLTPYTYIHTYMHTYKHAYIRTYIHTYIHMYIHIMIIHATLYIVDHACVVIHIHNDMCMCICTCICIGICICRYICICICKFITFAHISRHTSSASTESSRSLDFGWWRICILWI